MGQSRQNPRTRRAMVRRATSSRVSRVLRLRLRRGCLLLEQIADLDEQLGLGGSCNFFDDAGLCGLALLQLVHREDEREVDDQGDSEEVDDRADDAADQERTGRKSLKIFRVEDQRDQRVDEPGNQRVDDCGECRTNDDRDSQIDDISAGNEFLKALNHLHTPLGRAAHYEAAGVVEAFASFFDDDEFEPESLPVDDALDEEDELEDEELLDDEGTELLLAVRESVR